MKQRKLNITYRDLEKKDYPAVEKIIAESQCYDSICEKTSTARHLAKMYLKSCLAGGTFARVAVCRDRIIGVAIGTYEKDQKGHMRMSFGKELQKLRLRMSKEGRKALEQLQKADRIREAMEEACTVKFDGQVLLIAVTKAARGFGVEQELWNQLKGYFRAKSAKIVSLFADNAHNNKPVNEEGFHRIDSGSLLMNPAGQRFRLELYFYEYRFLCVTNE